MTDSIHSNRLELRPVHDKLTFMAIKITPELENAVHGIYAGGQYATETDVIAAALHLLQQRDQLRSELQQGLCRTLTVVSDSTPRMYSIICGGEPQNSTVALDEYVVRVVHVR